MTTPEVPPGAATILDVARRAGVSRTTVSRVLNEPDNVSAATLTRVRQAAEDLNYVPSTAARSLRSGRTGTIALLVGDIAQPFHGRLAKAVALSAGNRGMNVILCDLDHDQERLQQFLLRLPKQGVDGIIIATADDLSADSTRTAVGEAQAHGVPVVLTMHEPSLPSVPALHFDYVEVGRLATERLLHGGTSVVLLVGEKTGNVGRQLIAGYTEALTGHGEQSAGAALPLRVLEGAYSYEESARCIATALDAGEPIDGVVVATMPMALGVIRAVEERGLRIPDDIAIVVCEDVPLAAYVRPTVTSVGVDPDVNGESIVRLLEAVIRGEEPSVDPMPLGTIERETSRAVVAQA